MGKATRRGRPAHWIIRFAIVLVAAPAAGLCGAGPVVAATVPQQAIAAPAHAWQAAQPSGSAQASGSAQSSEAAPAAPTPVRTVPPIDKASADSCAPLTIEWMQTTTLGQVQVAATYLDPTVVLSCIKANYPDAAGQKAQIAKQLAGFPGTVRVALRLQAPDEGPLSPGGWNVTLSAGTTESAARSHTVTEEPDLVTQGTGTAYQETIVYEFANPGTALLPPKAAVLTAKIKGPSGSAQLAWNFSGKPLPATGGAGAGIDYIPILSWVVVGIGLLLVIALWITRPVIKQDMS